MMGLIHRLLFAMVEESTGTAGVREVKKLAAIPEDRDFRIDETYEDEEWRRLLDAACEVLSVNQAEAEVAFADCFYRDSLERWPTWFEISSSAREFLERQPAIHNGFATGVTDPKMRRQIIDKFRLEKRADKLIVRYRSPNRLCGLYIALGRKIIEHYGDKAVIDEHRCQRQGDTECEIHIVWE